MTKRASRPRSSSPRTRAARARWPARRSRRPRQKRDLRSPRAASYAARVSADRLSIVQVTPHRRGTPNAVNEYVNRVSEELGRRGHEVLVVGSGDAVKKRLATTPFDIVHVHEPFAPRVSSTALRHSISLNVATFHAPQERVLSTQVARPLVEIFFGRLDARTVATPATGELLERYFPGPYEVVEGAGEGRD